jgi:transcriptional regulator with XRE-family HTH domain
VIASNDAWVEKDLAEMPLDELRTARQLTQVHLAELLGMKQASISKMERRADMYVSTLAKFIEAMGGTLEIRACFPDGSVRINQFSNRLLKKGVRLIFRRNGWLIPETLGSLKNRQTPFFSSLPKGERAHTA